MSKRDSGSQFDLDLRIGEKSPQCGTSAPVVPFVDAATLQVRRDAMRRVATTGIFASHIDQRKG